jgi:hypothetical protein
MHIKIALNCAGTSNQEQILTPFTPTKAQEQLITDLLNRFTADLAVGGIDRQNFGQRVVQWYNEKRMVTIDEVVELVRKDNLAWKKQHTWYDWAKISMSVIPNDNGCYNLRVNVPFTWTGTDNEGKQTNKSDILHIGVFQYGDHSDRWYIGAVCNGDQIN